MVKNLQIIRVKSISILYHDVVSPDRDDSGFVGNGAERYKLPEPDFAEHLRTLAATGRHACRVIDGYPSAQGFFLTFDDGGMSAASRIAPALASLKWPAHFFMTSDRIGSAGFLTAEQLCALNKAGHVVGSHSASHPTRMAALNRQELLDEWRRSKVAIEDALGEAIVTASIPGGYYSRLVAETAAEAGYRFLFTSEPVARAWMVDGCLILGRYGVWRGMPAPTAAGFVAGRWSPRFRQWAFWNAKKTAKGLAGPLYLRMRKWLTR